MSEHALASGLQMKRRNPLAVWIGLPLITLGIYFYVWYYKIHDEMLQFDRRSRIEPVGPLLVVLLLGWLVVPYCWSMYNAGTRIANAQRAAGLVPTCSPVIGLALVFVLGLNTLYYQVELNKIIDRYGGQPPGTPVPLRA